MNELLQEQPTTQVAFKAWARRAIAELSDKVEGDIRGPMKTPLQAQAAELIRAAKLFAFQLGLNRLCDRLPAREYKCAIDAIRRLTEIADWQESAPAPVNGQPLTVLQAADALGISERTARDLIASGELGHHRVGSGRGRIRIRPRDLEAYQSRTQTGFSHLFR